MAMRLRARDRSSVASAIVFRRACSSTWLLLYAEEELELLIGASKGPSLYASAGRLGDSAAYASAPADAPATRRAVGAKQRTAVSDGVVVSK